MPTKVLNGRMFKVYCYVESDTGKKETLLRECFNVKDALEILAADEKRRCPFCNSSKCFRSPIKMDYSIDFVGSRMTGLELLICSKTEEFFVAEKKLKTSKQQGVCPWCGSHYTEKLPEDALIDRPPSILSGKNIEATKKEWLALLMRKNPYKCKHCNRVFAGTWYLDKKYEKTKK